MVYLTTSLMPVNTDGRLHSLLSMNGGRIKGLHIHFENMAEMINSAGGALLVISAVMALLNLVNMFIQRQMGRSPKLLFSHEGASLDTIRIGLGETIAFALELLVAADVIDTLTKPAHAYTLDSLYKIGLVVIIRTTLSYFLEKEVEGLEARMRK